MPLDIRNSLKINKKMRIWSNKNHQGFGKIHKKESESSNF